MRKFSPRSIQPNRDFLFPLRGGLDQVTPHSTITPGVMIDCVNYEIAPSNGYKPIDGFERYDGRLPSGASFQYMTFSNGNAAILENDTVTSSASSSSGLALTDAVVTSGDYATGDAAGYVVLLHQFGPLFVDGDGLQVSGVTRSTVVTAYGRNNSDSDENDEQFLYLAVEKLRSLIARVPGAGPVRGVWEFQGQLYAFRDNELQTACLMYLAGLFGWQQVSGVPALSPGGKYRFENNNFGEAASSIKMYGVDGVNDAFEFDGAVFTQIPGPSVEGLKPKFIRAHAKQLFLGYYNGQIYHSPIGQPTGVYSSVDGATRIGLGDEMVDWLTLPGDFLGVWCRDSIYVITGTSSEDWQMRAHTRDTGGIEGTAQRIGRTLFLSSSGITEFEATRDFGDFKESTISQRIEPLLNKKKGKCIGSCVFPDKSQYRLFFEDGTAIVVSLVSNRFQFTYSDYGIPVRCISAPKRAESFDKAIYFGSDDGFVYRIDSGYSLDDKPMTGFFRLPFNYMKSPSQKKVFKKVVIELEALRSVSLFLKFRPDYSLTDPDIPLHDDVVIEDGGILAGGTWDVDDWDTFAWSGGSGGGGGTAEGRLDGVATEISLLFYHEAPNTVTPPHVLNSINILHRFRGQRR